MMDKKEWLARRKEGITATDIAALAGVSPFAGPLDIYAQKKGFMEVEETPRMRMGSRMEPIIADLYSEQTRVALKDPIPFDLRQSPHNGLFLCTPDREGKEEPLVVELKNPRLREGWGEPGTDEVPTHYLLQTAWQMMVLGYDRADLAVLFVGDDEVKVFNIRRNAELEERLADIGLRFWKNHMVPDIPPPIDQGVNASQYLATVYPAEKHGTIIEADAVAVEALSSLHTARSAREAWERREEAMVNRIKSLIGDAAGIAGEGMRATWKKSKDRTTVDWEAVAKELNAPKNLVLKHTLTKPGPRVFRVNYGG